jgi:hypothetical protein
MSQSLPEKNYSAYSRRCADDIGPLSLLLSPLFLVADSSEEKAIERICV